MVIERKGQNLNIDSFPSLLVALLVVVLDHRESYPHKKLQIEPNEKCALLSAEINA
jgi:hypothetical protein